MTCDVLRDQIGLLNGDSRKSVLVEIQKQKQKIEDEGREPLNSSSGNGAGVGDNYIPMSMAAGIITAFLAMITYSNEINNQQNQLSQSWAKAMMGETTDSTGHVTVNIDDSIAGHWYDSSVASGVSQANGLRMQGIGSIIGAGASALGLGATGFKSYKQNADIGPLNSELAGARTYRGLLEGDGGTVQSGPAAAAPVDATVTARVQDLPLGRNIKFESGEVNETTRNAAQHLIARNRAPGNSGEELRRAIKAADQRISDAQSRLSSHEANFTTFANKINIASNAAQSGGQAAGSIGQAANATTQAQQKAQSDVSQQNLQQMQGSADKATQSAQTNHESANSMATALGQTLQATNR